MPGHGLILTYHAIEPGPAPLCVDPDLFAAHLDCLADCGAQILTVSELAGCLRAGELPDRAVAITFDDGFASVAERAAPLLLERGMVATVFGVAGHLGGHNDWPTQPARAPRRSLASAGQLAALARAGFEIGAHGVEHLPLAAASDAELRRELLDGRATLERAVHAPVATFAYPYGARAGRGGEEIVRREYFAACTTALELVRPETDPHALPRVDVHYVRRPRLLRRAVHGSLDHYLRVRRATARARRVINQDYVPARRPENNRR